MDAPQNFHPQSTSARTRTTVDVVSDAHGIAWSVDADSSKIDLRANCSASSEATTTSSSILQYPILDDSIQAQLHEAAHLPLHAYYLRTIHIWTVADSVLRLGGSHFFFETTESGSCYVFSLCAALRFSTFTSGTLVLYRSIPSTKRLAPL